MSDYEDVDRPGHVRRRRTREYIITTLILATLVIFLIIIIIFVIIYWPSQQRSNVGFYSKAAVATDSPECSTVGKKILLKNGSAVDAAIASLFCVSVHNFQSSGIGGGFFMVIYDFPKDGGKKEIVTYDAREVAPLAAHKDMFPNGSSSARGALTIAVPGEIKGYLEAWKRFGKLPWSELVSPTIKMCKDGFKISKPLAQGLIKNEQMVRDSPGLSKIFVNEDGTLKKEGDTLKLPKLAATLEQVAKEPLSFYNGSLAMDILEDIKEMGGIITGDDLSGYKVVVTPPYTSRILSTNLTLHSLPSPSSGPILAFMLNILGGYNMSSEDLDGVSKSSLTYHRIIEMFKFGYSKKTFFGDPAFNNLSEILTNFSSPEFVDYIRSRITSNMTHLVSYYEPQPGAQNVEDRGTCHLSVYAPNGAAVAVTTTINYYFGSGVVGRRTGILFNNEMTDFAIPSPTSSVYGKENFIEPGKRPMSSMVPAIILDQDGQIRFVIGGSGGSKITSAVAYVIAHRLWLGYKIDDAVDRLRLHYKLSTNVVEHEKGFNQKIMYELKQKGHNMTEEELSSLTSVVQAIESTCGLGKKKAFLSNGKCLIAVSDYRKSGKPDGF